MGAFYGGVDGVWDGEMGEGAGGAGGREYGDVGLDVEYLGELCAVRARATEDVGER